MILSRITVSWLTTSLFASYVCLAAATPLNQTKSVEVLSNLALTFADDDQSTPVATVTLKNLETVRRTCIPWPFFLPGWQDGFLVQDARGVALPQRGPDEFVDPKKYLVDFLIIPPGVSVSVTVPLSGALKPTSAGEMYSIAWHGVAFECPPPSKNITWYKLSRMQLPLTQLHPTVTFQVPK